MLLKGKFMKKIIFMLIVLASIGFLSGCAPNFTVTADLVGTDGAYSSTAKAYVAVAEGSFVFISTKPTSSDVIAQKEFTPSTTASSVEFELAGNKGYTVFIYFDKNVDGEYDSADDVQTELDGMVFLEENTTIAFTYYF